MNTVIFELGGESYDSYTDLGLILNSKSIGSPKVKTNYVDIPGADGKIDYTDYFGDVKFENRQVDFSFQKIDPLPLDDTDLKNLLHGQKCKIFLSELPDFYFVGRVDVGEWQKNKKVASVKISCDCEAWRYKASETVKTVTVSGSGNITLSNLRKSAVPKITTSAAVVLSFGGITANLSSGTDVIVDSLVLKKGNTTIQITGNSTVTFKYQEGSL